MSAGAQDPGLFSPGILGGLRLKNRLVMPAMTSNYACRDGRVTRRMVDYYAARSAGGVGMIVVEAACVESPRGKGMINELDISSDACLPGLKQLSYAIRGQGSCAAIQLHHAGSLRLFAEPIPEPPIAPSSLRYRGFDTPREAGAKEIRSLQNRFAQAAERAKKAGFQAVELHGAHGYLICQFLSPLTNRRTDPYGGSLENRVRFFAETINQVREAVGPGFPVICRVSADEFAEGGLEADEAEGIARHLEQAGADAIHVSVSSTPEKSRRELMSNVPPMELPEGTWVHLAERIRKACRIPVIAVGRIHTPALAEEVLASGRADFIAVGRALIADPQWPNKVREHRIEEIRPCIACNNCIHRVLSKEDLSCTVNPLAGREREENPSSVAGAPKRVLVLGGGPAGMEAALAATSRGHFCEIWERSGDLGGLLHLAAVPPGKQTLQRFCEFLITQVQKAGVQIRTRLLWQEQDIQRFGPDAIVVATGSQAGRPSFSGADEEHVFTGREVLGKKIQTGGRVVVVGGGDHGCEVAQFLAEEGKTVTLVERLPWLAQDLEPIRRRIRMKRLGEMGVLLLLETKVCRHAGGTVTVVSGDGQVQEIEADTVVVCAEPTPDRETLERVRRLAPEVYTAGDALRPRGILEAVLEGHMLGSRL